MKMIQIQNKKRGGRGDEDGDVFISVELAKGMNAYKKPARVYFST